MGYFEPPHVLSNTLSLFFEKQDDIKGRSKEMENILNELLPNTYSLSAVLSIPDQADPSLPRIVFNSAVDYSQVFVSQINITIQVNYPEDGQADFTKIKQDVARRMSVLFNIARKANLECLYGGILSSVVLYFNGEDRELIEILSKKLLRIDYTNTHDIEIKITTCEGKFYKNLTYRNFRDWDTQIHYHTIRLSDRDIKRRGVLIVCDYNDRYAYNESVDYKTSESITDDIIEGTFNTINESIELLKS